MKIREVSVFVDESGSFDANAAVYYYRCLWIEIG